MFFAAFGGILAAFESGEGFVGFCQRRWSVASAGKRFAKAIFPVRRPKWAPPRVGAAGDGLAANVRVCACDGDKRQQTHVIGQPPREPAMALATTVRVGGQGRTSKKGSYRTFFGETGRRPTGSIASAGMRAKGGESAGWRFSGMAKATVAVVLARMFHRRGRRCGCWRRRMRKKGADFGSKLAQERFKRAT